jgi:acetyl-CoA acetyltransferase
MKDVYILAAGQIPVAKYADQELGKLGGDAITRALEAADLDKEFITGLYVGNMLSGILSQQQLLGPLLADAAGLTNCEALTIEAACGSGGGAMRAGVMAIASGMHRAVVVCGVEKMSHASREDTTRGLATASHWPTEGGMGESFVTLNARLMAAYRDAYSLEAADFAPFAINAHQNATTNDCAMLRKSINLKII